MAMRECRACGKSVRKTVRAMVIGFGGGNVCQECASGGLLVVAPKLQQVQARPRHYVRSADTDRVLRMLNTYAKAARASAKAALGYAGAKTADSTHFEGRAEGIETAIQTLTEDLKLVRDGEEVA